MATQMDVGGSESANPALIVSAGMRAEFVVIAENVSAIFKSDGRVEHAVVGS